MALTPDPSSDPEAVPLGLLRRYLMAHGWRRPTVVARDLSGEQSAITRAFLQGRTGGKRDFDRLILSEKGLEDIEIILPRDKSDRAPWRGVGLVTSSRSPARLAGFIRLPRRAA